MPHKKRKKEPVNFVREIDRGQAVLAYILSKSSDFNTKRSPEYKRITEKVNEIWGCNLERKEVMGLLKQIKNKTNLNYLTENLCIISNVNMADIFNALNLCFNLGARGYLLGDDCYNSRVGRMIGTGNKVVSVERVGRNLYRINGFLDKNCVAEFQRDYMKWVYDSRKIDWRDKFKEWAGEEKLIKERESMENLGSGI